MAAYSERCHFDKNTLITLILFKNVENSTELRQLIRNGKMDCSLLRSSVILDKFQVLVAANKAILAQRNHAMTTRSISTEIIYNMSCSKNISDSLAKFGICDEDENVLAVIVDDLDGQKLKKLMNETICGTVVDIGQLPRFANETHVKKLYKIKEAELRVGSLLDAVVCRISTKDLVSF